MTQPQYEKNPNGGYLNKSSYGQDGWYGTITITPALLAEIQRTGKVLIEVKDVQTTAYGDCRRIVAKEYTPKEQVAHTPRQEYAPQPAPQPQYAPAPQYAPQPVAPAPVQAPAAPVAMPNDGIPF